MSTRRPAKNSDREGKSDFKSGTSRDKIKNNAIKFLFVLYQNCFLFVCSRFMIMRSHVCSSALGIRFHVHLKA